MPIYAKSFLPLILFVFSIQAGAQVYQNWNLVFPTSQSAEAQEHFLDGVTYMHLHMFEDAEAHFRLAQRLAPDFAMAYWGEALSQHRTIWNIHRLDVAREVLARLGATPAARAAKAPTPREKAYLAAVETLFGEGAFRERQSAYSNAMRDLSVAYPDDIEASAFYALSLMRETPIDMTRQQTRSLMATISMQVLAQNPRHPGANRYLIQSTDDPENTDLGLLAVNNLRLIDTDAAEALHIPSHYYLQHGMWEAVADANMRAFESSMAWVEENDFSLQDLNAHNYGHLLQFANYGYLQAGNLAQAAKIRERVRADYIASGLAAEIETPFADVYARWILDLERWQDAELLAELAREYSIRSAGLWQAIGIAAARSDNLALANEAVNLLGSLSDNPASQGVNSSRQVEGLIHLAQGHNDIALGILSEAAQLNWAQPVTLIGVPPRPLKPAMETYGEALLQTGDATAALAQFQQGLTRYRGRTNLLLGAARAANSLGREDLAQHYYSQLAEIWQRADSRHPFTAEVSAKNQR
ncbi:MAG: hypothetical protein IIB72_14100 [Proteobacteria bacterium]|nr:hypothetical protein [Pseudomonadota bacterium]